MSDVSSNEIIEDEELTETQEDQETSEDVSGNSVHYTPEQLYEVNRETETSSYSEYDYSNVLQNIETITMFQSALIIALILLVGFTSGWKRD